MEDRLQQGLLGSTANSFLLPGHSTEGHFLAPGIMGVGGSCDWLSLMVYEHKFNVASRPVRSRTDVPSHRPFS